MKRLPKLAEIWSKSPITRHRAHSAAIVTESKPISIGSPPPVAIASSLLFDSAHYHKGECVLHLFRKEAGGTALHYDITINDSLLTRSNNNWIETITLPATGIPTLSAKTESTSSITLNLQPGYHYYIRCGVNLGVLVGRPTLEVVEPTVAKAEIDAIQQNALEAESAN